MSSKEDMTIRQAQRRVKNLLDMKGKDWTQIDNRFFLFTYMNEEIGELARHMITAEFNLNLDRSAKEPTPRQKVISLIEDDLGDILYHIIKIAISYDIDLAEAFETAMSSIEKRYGEN